jgi:hypothetical protein
LSRGLGKRRFGIGSSSRSGTEEAKIEIEEVELVLDVRWLVWEEAVELIKYVLRVGTRLLRDWLWSCEYDRIGRRQGLWNK